MATAVGGGYECANCGEFIAADSVRPDECPECGSTEWKRVG